MGAQAKPELKRRLVTRGAVCTAAAALALAFASPAMAAPGVDPATVEVSAAPGSSFPISKVVHTPEIPVKPDVVLLVDTTGSMGGAIGNVQTNLHQVVTDVLSAQPSAQFAVASYKDTESCDADSFTVQQNLTASEPDVQAAVNTLSASGGCDYPEDYINALFQVSTGAISYRAGSSRIVVLVGDAPSHDPSAGHTLADAIGALNAASTRVVGVNVAGLDDFGQATAITGATGGSLVPVSAGDVTSAILAGLKGLDVTVKPTAMCAAGLSVSFDHDTATVPSGSDANFGETVTVAASATAGSTLHCTVDFTLNGASGGAAFIQTVTVHVTDTVAPTAACTPTNNPSGRNTPKAVNEDGFYQLSAKDNVDSAPQVWIRDSKDASVNFGPFPAGTKIKLVQAPGATQSVKPGTGDINYKVTLRGDALIVSIDASGNASAAVSCLVPPPPK